MPFCWMSMSFCWTSFPKCCSTECHSARCHSLMPLHWMFLCCMSFCWMSFFWMPRDHPAFCHFIWLKKCIRRQFWVNKMLLRSEIWDVWQMLQNFFSLNLTFLEKNNVNPNRRSPILLRPTRAQGSSFP